MKRIFISLFFIATLFNLSLSQTVFWSENFNNGCNSLCMASSYTGPNGTWVITNNGAATACGAATIPNEWFISCAENGNAVGACGTGCGNNATLHVGNYSTSPSASIFCPTGDCGAAYDAGGYCGLLATPPSTETDKRAESPTINCTGYSNITISFKYLEEGDAANDDATLWYYDGATWSQIDPIAKSNNSSCSPQGKWTAFSLLLPASANNNPNVKIGFRWVNDDDGNGNDPSFAVDDVQLSVVTGTPPVANFTVTNTICAGQCVTFTDGSTGSPTSWSWAFPGATPTSSTQQNPANICYNTAGTYTATLTATNANGSGSSSQVITVNPAPAANAGADVTICPGTNTTLTATGGGTYAWNTGATTASISVNPTATTAYSVTVTNSCGSSTDAVNVVVSNNITAAVSGNTTICSGQSATLTASGGSNYSWSNGTTTATVVISPSSTSTYSVFVSSGTCADTASATVTVTSSLTAIISGNTSFCQGQNATLCASGGCNYVWNNGVSSSCIVVSAAGFYYCTASCGGCSDSASATVTANPDPVASAASNITIAQGGNATLTASGGGTYSWSNGNTNAVISVSPSATTFYCVTITNANNCSDSACVTVTVEPTDCSNNGELYLPNVFSPNGDGENDSLQAYYKNFLCVESFHLKIYDRWGEKVFETNDPLFRWDGADAISASHGKEKNIVLTYFLDASLKDGKTISKKGNITLLR